MQFCDMELLQLIFKLGVVFAIFSFIWGFFELTAKLLTNGRSKTMVEIYVIKALKYAFLVDVTFLFSLDKTQEIVDLNNLIPTILVVLVYLLGYALVIWYRNRNREKDSLNSINNFETIVYDEQKKEINESEIQFSDPEKRFDLEITLYTSVILSGIVYYL